MARTALRGWKRYGHSPDPRVRARFRREARILPIQYAAAIAGARAWFKNDRDLRKLADDTLRDLVAEFGWRSRLAAFFGGPYVLWSIKREAHAMENKPPVEPPTFYEPAMA